MYDPQGNSVEKAEQEVRFTEVPPPAHLRSVVHRFLELRTERPRAEPYRFHALPDACTYVVLDQLNLSVAGVTKLRASSEELDLGRHFHFVNIRFLPGVWNARAVPVSYGQIDDAYTGPLALSELNTALIGAPLDTQIQRLVAFVETLVADKVVTPNPVTELIFAHMDDVFSVADMAELAGISARHLQRLLKQTTGLTPHDFLKVLRLQQSLRGEPSLAYADQSHFIHSFRKATGYTPGQYAKKFDV